MNPTQRSKILILALFVTFAIYETGRRLNKTALSTADYTNIKGSGQGSNTHIIRTVENLKSTNEETNIAAYVSSNGIIDPRTNILVEKTNEMFISNSWWLLGQCECYAPVWNMLWSPFKPIDRIVSAEAYMTEIYLNRTIVTLCHNAAVKESGGDGIITLLTQCTPHRLHMFQYLIDSWPGPINMAVYVNRREFEENYNRISTLLTESGRRNIIVHIVISTGELYPINWLRNLVTQNATSEYVFTIDMDFIPSKNLMQTINYQLLLLEDTSQKDVLILVPAVEMLDSDAKELPLTKSELLPYIASGQADVFHKGALGQTLWHVEKWTQADTPYLLTQSGGLECNSVSEPYIIVPRKLSPLYPETLLERGFNKVAYFVELCAYDYKFLVINDGFVLHKFHEISLRALKQVRHCTDCAFETFKLHTAQTVGKRHMFDRQIPLSYIMFTKCVTFNLISVLILLLLLCSISSCCYCKRSRHRTTSVSNRTTSVSNRTTSASKQI